MGVMFDAAAGLLCGVLSGCGIGGGSLLLIYMTAVAGLGQAEAQGINLIYFIPTSAAALVSHFKNRLVNTTALIWAAIPGCAVSLAASIAATCMDSAVLKKLFGAFLVVSGVRMLLRK